MLTRLRAGGSDSRLHASSALGGEERGLGSCSPDRPRKSSSPFPAAASAVAAAAAAEAAAKVKSPSASLLPGAAADLGCGISLQQCGKLGFCTSEQLLCPLLEAPLFCPQQKNKKGKLEGAFFPFHFHFSSSSVQFPTLHPPPPDATTTYGALPPLLLVFLLNHVRRMRWFCTLGKTRELNTCFLIPLCQFHTVVKYPCPKSLRRNNAFKSVQKFVRPNQGAIGGRILGASGDGATQCQEQQQ